MHAVSRTLLGLTFCLLVPTLAISDDLPQLTLVWQSNAVLIQSMRDVPPQHVLAAVEACKLQGIRRIKFQTAAAEQQMSTGESNWLRMRLDNKTVVLTAPADMPHERIAAVIDRLQKGGVTKFALKAAPAAE